MNKQDRLLAIREIISHENISSQEEILKKLEGRGIQCTQATLSRNLRQLRVSRVPDGRGNLKYVLSDKTGAEATKKEAGDLSNAVVDTIWAQNMLLIKTDPGYAAAVASYIDRANQTEIAGTVAGDDTILLIPYDKYPERTISQVLKKILPGI